MGNGCPGYRNIVSLSERSAQLYMRIAKNWEPSRAPGHDTSDVPKLLNFAREMEHLSGDELMQRCIDWTVCLRVAVDQDCSSPTAKNQHSSDLLRCALHFRDRSFALKAAEAVRPLHFRCSPKS